MFTRKGFVGAFALALMGCSFVTAVEAAGGAGSQAFGSPATQAQIGGWNLDVLPSGAGLPSGRGTPAEGSKLYAAQCAACHGAEGQGIPVPGHGMFPRLVGGIGTIATDAPAKTVGSFWPYATGLFDYIRRAMPFTKPQSLTSDQVYALTAFILAKNGIIPDDAVINAQTLPAVKMPNRDGFYSRPAPETDNVAAYSVTGP